MLDQGSDLDMGLNVEFRYDVDGISGGRLTQVLPERHLCRQGPDYQDSLQGDLNQYKLSEFSSLASTTHQLLPWVLSLLASLPCHPCLRVEELIN
jgi:hypothetical protein